MQDKQQHTSEAGIPVHEPPKDPEASPLPPEQKNHDDKPVEEEDKTEVVQSASHDGLKSALSTIAIIVLAPLIAFMLTALVFQSYEVDGASMETTLQNQDRLIVLKVPRTIAKITRHPYIPSRGDVIIFNKNDLAEFAGTSAKRQLVKRVIGLPGDHIIIKDGNINIFNAQHPDGFDPDKTLPYGNGPVGPSSPTTCGGSYCDIVIPQNEVFVCGDNRSNSLDSRIFGPVPANDIVGKLSMRIYPFNKLKVF